MEVDVDFEPEQERPAALRKRSAALKGVKPTHLTRANPMAARQMMGSKRLQKSAKKAPLIDKVEEDAHEKIRADEKLLFGSKASDTLNSLHEKGEDDATKQQRTREISELFKVKKNRISRLTASNISNNVPARIVSQTIPVSKNPCIVSKID